MAIASALKSLYSLGYIHRDLQPVNVWIDGNGSAKLAGFDFAVECKGEIALAEVVGHPAYRAPEVDEGFYSQAGDLWSLAVCLYEMVYDKLPFGQEPYSEEYVERQTKQ